MSQTVKKYVEQIYTPTGITKENIFSAEEKVLHIGSGANVLAGAETVDILDLPGVDTVHDLDRFPWPYKENEFDVIFAHSVFEHLEDQLAVMEEMARILKSGGRVVITVPYFRCVDAYSDPTHTTFFTTKTMDYYIKGTQVEAFGYTECKFKQIGLWFGWPTTPKRFLVRKFKNYIAKNHEFYDKYLSLLLPVDVLIWELEVLK